MSPTQLTLAQLRKDGYTARVVERWNQYARVRQDCFGFDVLAAKPRAVGTGGPIRLIGGGILGVQACAGAGKRGGDFAAHRDKILRNQEAATWIAAGGRLEIWAWSTRRSEERTKAGKRSKRLVHHLRREEITLADFVPSAASISERAKMFGHQQDCKLAALLVRIDAALAPRDSATDPVTPYQVPRDSGKVES